MEETAVWKDGFIFLGNELALDFLNTRPVLNDEAVELLPDFSSLIRWFIASGVLQEVDAKRLLRSPAKARSHHQRVLLSFRERLRTEIRNWERSGIAPAAFLEDLNHRLRTHPMRVRLAKRGDAIVAEEYFHPETPADLIAPLAASVARLLATADHTRIRQCDACVLHFRDISKKGTRRWCSMAICGNRAKVAAYAERQRDK